MIYLGAKVRLYYSEDTYDEGEVTDISNSVVTVDFYDWIDRYPENGFSVVYPFQREIFVPNVVGETIVDFRRK